LSKQNVPTSSAKATPKTCVIAEESVDKREMIVSVLDGKIVHEQSVRDAEGGLTATHADQVNADLLKFLKSVRQVRKAA
jgi:hypothetical protein